MPSIKGVMSIDGGLESIKMLMGLSIFILARTGSWSLICMLLLKHPSERMEPTNVDLCHGL